MSAPPPPLLQVRDLAVSFSSDTSITGRTQAVDGVSMTIHPGQTLAVVGESGCGKSVTALSLLHLLPRHTARVDRGTAIFNTTPVQPVPLPCRSGHGSALSENPATLIDLLSLSEKEIRTIRGSRIAMIFQEPMSSLNPVFTIGDQIIEAILLHQPVKRAAARAIAVQSLRDIGITDPERRLGAYPHQFSGGMRQRVMIAMALCCKPALLLADEPTTALDVTIQKQILELLRDLKSRTGMAIMLITHDLGVVSENADAVCVMYAGRVVEYAAVQDLFATPLHPYTRGLLACIPSLARRVDRLTTIADLLQHADAHHISGSPHLQPWWPNHTPPNGLAIRDSILLEVHPNHWVATWRTPDLASTTPRPPDITPTTSSLASSASLR